MGGEVPVSAFEDGYAAARRGDFAAAIRLWRPLAERGDANAQHNLGFIYQTGRGVRKDPAAAVIWYRRAAEQRNPDAQGNLGLMYAKGAGVLQDKVLAYMWFTLAAARGNEDAARNREILRRRMSRRQIDKAERLARAWKPAQALPTTGF